MPNTLFAPEDCFPDLDGCATTEQKLDAMRDYLYLLLESLRWTLRNLSPANFNESELAEWAEELDTGGDTIITNTLITNELYAQYGAIADLTVDELRTDYIRALRYQARNTAPLDWLYIHDEEIDFLTDTVAYAGGAPVTEQLHHRSRYFWWTDETQTQMTSAEPTAWPVTVYRYTTLVKGSFRFETVGGVKIPTLILGAGVGDPGDPDLGRGFLRKNTDSLALWLHGAKDNGVFIGEYTDLVGLRRTTAIDFSGWDGGSFSETVDGSITHSYAVSFGAGGVPVKITDGDGHETAVIWE